jgi:tetratricopeptide (TPR) repeat protein
MDHEESPQEQIKLILELFSNGQIQEALDAVEVLIKDYPNESLLFNISGACYAGLGQFDDAVKDYEKAIAIKPDYSKAHFNLGCTLQELGQLDASAKSFEKALVIEPNYAEAHNNLGITLKDLRQLDAAVKSFKKAIAIKPDYVEAHYSLGATFQELGQLDDAVKSYKEVVNIEPDFAEMHNNLGVILNKLNQKDAALKSLETAVAIKPDFAEAHYNLGNALNDLGQLDMATKSYERALAIKPDYAEAHNNLGNTLNDLGQHDDAVKRFEKAIAIQPNYVQAHNNLGDTFHELGQLETATKSYEKVIAIKPDFAEAHNNLGITYQQLGQINDSINQYEKALAINPNYSDVYFNLSYLNKYTFNDSQITKIKSLLSDSKLSLSDRIYLCFALAKVNENLDNQDELFKYLNEANSLNKQKFNYSLDRSKTLFSSVKEMFSSAYSGIEKSLSSEPSTFKPIFIVGMPRSGSTLVEQIISSHHLVHGAGELNNLPDIIAPIARDYVNQGMNKLPETAFLSIRKRYLDVLSNLNVPESVITDKLPLNFQYIGFILSAFPEAKIVHMKRDARATCWSNYNSIFSSPEFGFSNNIEDLTGFYGLYSDLMDYWHQLYPGKIYDMYYEDLTINQEEETRKLIQYCELDWDKNCLSFHQNKRAVQTASSLQVRQKMYQGSSEAWKKHEAYLQPLIKALISY